MKHFIYTIFDNKAKSYSLPFYQINEQVCLRVIQDAVNNPESHLGQHPEDYILFQVGSYDDITSEFEISTPIIVCKLHELTQEH